MDVCLLHVGAGYVSVTVSLLEPQPLKLAACKTLEITHPQNCDARDPHTAPNQTKMILTTCPACAKPLAHDAPRCVRCKLRYCNKTCQHDQTLVKDPAATFDDLHEAVTTLEDAGRTARRVLGGAHPLTTEIGQDLQKSRTVLHAREASSKTTN